LQKVQEADAVADEMDGGPIGGGRRGRGGRGERNVATAAIRGVQLGLGNNDYGSRFEVQQALHFDVGGDNPEEGVRGI